MTLVLVAFFAAIFPMSLRASVDTPQPKLDEPEKAKTEQSQKAPSEILGTIDITQPKKTTHADEDEGIFASKEYFFPYRHSLSPRVAIVYNVEGIKEHWGPLYSVGFQHLFQVNQKSYEVGADILTRGSGRVHAAKRWFFSRARTRPYTKAGLGVVINPDQGFTTLLRYENLQLRGGAGVEFLLTPPLSFRADIEAAAGIEQQEATVAFGYSWAW